MIYNYIKKKYIRYICLMLNKFREIDLQMNIKKCEFDVETIVFLNVIISKFDLQMNSEKKNYRQLNHFNRFKKNAKFREICKLLSTIY